MEHQEVECRFLEIDKIALVRKLLDLGAKDFGETMLEETIIYDADSKWKDSNRFVRLRKTENRTQLSYKEHTAHTVDGAYEIEFEVSDYAKAELLFKKIGLVPYRHQQKKRHTLRLDGVTFDIDTWPRIPTYVELEADSEDLLRNVVSKIGFAWENAIFNNAAWVIEERYGIPVRKLRWFTFDRLE